jgi:hypothetical protein
MANPSQKVVNATQSYLASKLVEGALDGNIGMSLFLARAKAGMWRGAQEEVPFKFEKNVNGGSFSGADTLSTAMVDNTIKLTFDCKFNEIPTVLAKTDLSLNKTEMERADLMERQIASDAVDLADTIGNQFYQDGSGNGGKDILGLAGIVDDGTTLATIGGQARATYPALNATVTATGGTLTLAQMYTAWDAASEGNQEPDFILTTKSIRSLYNQLLDPKQRYDLVGELKGKDAMFAGVKQLMFRSAPVIGDSKCPSGLMYFLNSDSFEFRYLDKYEGATAAKFSLEELDGEPSGKEATSLGFHWTGWTQSTNQEVLVGRAVHAGNFVVKNPRYNAVLTGITGI